MVADFSKQRKERRISLLIPLTYSDALPSVMVADGSTAQASGIGEVQLTDSIMLHRVLYVQFFSFSPYISSSTQYSKSYLRSLFRVSVTGFTDDAEGWFGL